jgi:hypothetical protein
MEEPERRRYVGPMTAKETLLQQVDELYESDAQCAEIVVDREAAEQAALSRMGRVSPKRLMQKLAEAEAADDEADFNAMLEDAADDLMAALEAEEEEAGTGSWEN